MKTPRKKKQRKDKRSAVRPLLLAVVGATTLYAACGDDSTSGNLIYVPQDLGVDLSAIPPDLSKKD